MATNQPPGWLKSKFNPFTILLDTNCEPKGFSSAFRTRMIKTYNIIYILYCIAIILVLWIGSSDKIINDPDNSFKIKWSIVFSIFVGILLFIVIPFSNIGVYGNTRYDNLSRPVDIPLPLMSDILCKPGTGTEKPCDNNIRGYLTFFLFLAFGISLIIFGVEYNNKITNDANNAGWKNFGTMAISFGVMFIILSIGVLIFTILCPFGTRSDKYGTLKSFLFIFGYLAIFIAIGVGVGSA